MATQLQKPFFCPLEPRAEDDNGFVTDHNSEIESRQHTLLRAARGSLGTSTIRILVKCQIHSPETTFISKVRPNCRLAGKGLPRLNPNPHTSPTWHLASAAHPITGGNCAAGLHLPSRIPASVPNQ